MVVTLEPEILSADETITLSYALIRKAGLYCYIITTPYMRSYMTSYT
jgi:uncharacterized MAPEG superfamily protein